jgi:menaquinone-specific isochorismate synthase
MTTAPLGVPLVVRTLPLTDPGPLLDLLPRTAPLAWVRRGEGIVGWGAVARIDLAASTEPGQRFARADQAWSEVVARALVRDVVGLPGTGLVAFGSFSFAPSSPVGSVLVVPEVVVGHRGGTWWLTTVSAGGLPPPPDLPDVEPVSAPGEISFADGALPAPQWAGAVAEAIAQIGAGTVEKVVLARDMEARAAGPIDPRWPLHRLAERYPGCWTFCVDGLLGATPELLVRREKGLVTSRVLAGTIRRTGDDARDLSLAASLARSSKDLEEHEYAVRSVADALAPHCTSTNVPESPFVLHLANVMHLATDVTGVLADSSSSLALAQALHPSAAVCGTPTATASELIARLERMDRDRYAGPVGWIDAEGDGEWGLALRCGRLSVQDPRKIRLFAGCGIVAGSDPDAEVAESVAKLVPMRDALSD